jgi:hypothetical protein
MIRPINHFEDLRALALSAAAETANGLAGARSFTPVVPPDSAGSLDQLDPAQVLAIVFDGSGHQLAVTAAMLAQHLAATVPEHARHCTAWLARCHLRNLAADPENPA